MRAMYPKRISASASAGRNSESSFVWNDASISALSCRFAGVPGLGAVEFAQGRHDKALQAYRSAQRLAPQAALPRAHAGEALLFMGKVPEALKELKAAMDLEPDGDAAKLAQSLIQAKEAGILPPAKK